MPEERQIHFDDQLCRSNAKPSIAVSSFLIFSYSSTNGSNCNLSGKTLTIKAAGNFTAEVVEGAYINLSVKYGLITLLRQQADLCEQMKNVDEECPLDGQKVLTKDVELPSRIPPVSDVGYLISSHMLANLYDLVGKVQRSR